MLANSAPRHTPEEQQISFLYPPVSHVAAEDAGGSPGLPALQPFTWERSWDGIVRAAPQGVSEQGAQSSYCYGHKTAATIHLPPSAAAPTFSLRHLPQHALPLPKYMLFRGAHGMQTSNETKATFVVPCWTAFNSFDVLLNFWEEYHLWLN